LKLFPICLFREMPSGVSCAREIDQVGNGAVRLTDAVHFHPIRIGNDSVAAECHLGGGFLAPETAARLIGFVAVVTPEKGMVPCGALSRMEGPETGLLASALRAFEASFRQVAVQ
jgi:hypothetical protein